MITTNNKLSHLKTQIAEYFSLSRRDKDSQYYIDACYNSLCEFFSLSCSQFTGHRISQDDPFVTSLASRMFMVLNSDSFELEDCSKIRDKINLLSNNTNDEIFRIASCSQYKETILSLQDGIKKTYTFFVDWQTGRLFVKVKGRETDFSNRQNDGYSVQTYCLADCNELDHLTYDRRTKSWTEPKPIDEDYLDNIIVCDRFDTKHMKGEAIHPNKLNNLTYQNEIEKSLFKKYFAEQVSGNSPHFHFYSEMISLSLRNNNASLAMEPYRLAAYMRDLAIAADSTQHDNSGILDYPLCMPYLDIACGKLVYENENFLETAKALVSAYSRSTNNAKISELFAGLDKLVPATGSPIGKAANDMLILAEVMGYLPPEGQVELAEAFTKGYENSNSNSKSHQTTKSNNQEQKKPSIPPKRKTSDNEGFNI